MLILGKQASSTLFFQNILANPIISEISFSWCHTLVLYCAVLTWFTSYTSITVLFICERLCRTSWHLHFIRFKPIRAKRYIDVVQLVLITDIRKIVKSYQTLTPKLWQQEEISLKNSYKTYCIWNWHSKFLLNWLWNEQIKTRLSQ